MRAPGIANALKPTHDCRFSQRRTRPANKYCRISLRKYRIEPMCFTRVGNASTVSTASSRQRTSLKAKQRRRVHGSKDLAITPLLSLRGNAAPRRKTAAAGALNHLLLPTAHCCVDSCIEDVVYTLHLFRGALHVHRAHLLCNGATLLLCNGCQALCLQQLDTASLVAKIGFEAAEDDWGCWAKMKNFGVPLDVVSLKGIASK